MKFQKKRWEAWHGIDVCSSQQRFKVQNKKEAKYWNHTLTVIDVTPTKMRMNSHRTHQDLRWASSLITDPNMNLPVKSKRVPDWGYDWLLLLQHAPQKNSEQGNDHHKQEREPSLLLADFSPHQFLHPTTSKNCCFRKICIVLGFYLPTPSILKVTVNTIPTVWNIGGKWQCGFPKCWMSKFLMLISFPGRTFQMIINEVINLDLQVTIITNKWKEPLCILFYKFRIDRCFVKWVCLL